MDAHCCAIQETTAVQRSSYERAYGDAVHVKTGCCKLLYRHMLEVVIIVILLSSYHAVMILQRRIRFSLTAVVFKPVQTETLSLPPSRCL